MNITPDQYLTALTNFCSLLGFDYELVKNDPDIRQAILEDWDIYYPQRKSINASMPEIKDESENIIIKREVKTEDKKPLSSRFIGIKRKEKIEKNKIVNSSVADINASLVGKNLENNYLYNLNRKYSLFFVKSNHLIYILDKKKNKQEYLGYFTNLYPAFDLVLDNDNLPITALIAIQEWLSQIKQYSVINGEISQNSGGKISDLKYWLIVNEFTYNGSLMAKLFDDWYKQKSFKALQNFIEKYKKKFKPTDPIVWYRLEKDIRIPDQSILFPLWKRYHQN